MADPDPEPYYDKNEVLGRGEHTTVFAGDPGLAVKRIEKERMVERLRDREEAAMRQMDHPNVIKLVDVQETPNFKFWILERCLGTVRDYINGDKMYKDHMPTEVEALMQMASGLAYIHSQNIVHRDIKPDNVLIANNSDPKLKFVLKISDFACSKPMTQDGKHSYTGPRGTRAYHAPEYLRLEDGKMKDEEMKNIREDKSIDIFPLGCLFFTYIVKKGTSIHLFSTPGKPFNLQEKDESDVTENIRNDRKYIEENGIPSEHYAFKMIDGMTKARSEHRWVLNEGKPGKNSVLGTLEMELQRE
ncbi:serine/threonine-protein kinase/endoribonuclease IRE1 isoform X2 [Daphnia magna]|uniref:serine/threonine-protein kinase/endoribonuclease IRE1 isoform X2 n=1 Tax=Daphnia magna TaxID=35525 RepID=UPI001E1BD08B|nr:serine/threonine-protein kinase/endoribonuclease IRE1 isoform X2 [Daphnia magna]